MKTVTVSWGLLCLLFCQRVLGEDGGPCGAELRDISVFPGEPDYNDALRMYNALYSLIRPAFIAFPRTEDDVMRCLQCSAQHAAPCVVRSGGHSSAGYSTIDGTKNNAFVIYLAKMQAISVGRDTVQVQAGARWRDVYELLDRLDSQQLVTGGMCPVVGTAGFTLGGGYSMLSRKYGLAIDNVVSMRMVTANGSRVVFVNESVNFDLFWALRGGGGGNFGVVTEFTFKTHTVAYKNYTLVELNFEPGAKSRQALTAIGQVNSQLPREVYLDMMITSSKELSVFCVFIGVYKAAIYTLKPLLDLASKINYSSFDSYYSLSANLADKRNLSVPTLGIPFMLQGCILKELDPNSVDIMFSLDFPHSCVIAFMHLGGAIADISTTNTAYFNRQGTFDYYSPCLYQSKEEETAAYSFVNELYTRLDNGGHCDGTYVNDLTKLLPQWQEECYGKNYPRLLEIKERWNPVGVGYFHFPQEIGSNDSKED